MVGLLSLSNGFEESFEDEVGGFLGRMDLVGGEPAVVPQLVQHYFVCGEIGGALQTGRGFQC